MTRGSVMIVMPHTTVLKTTDKGAEGFVPLSSYGVVMVEPEAHHARFIGWVAALGLHHVNEGYPLSNQGMPKKGTCVP